MAISTSIHRRWIAIGIRIAFSNCYYYFTLLQMQVRESLYPTISPDDIMDLIVIHNKQLFVVADFHDGLYFYSLFFHTHMLQTTGMQRLLFALKKVYIQLDCVQ